MWQYRSQLDWLGTENNNDLGDEKLDDEIFSYHGLNLGDIFENVTEDNYVAPLPASSHDEITKKMLHLQVSMRIKEHEVSKSMDAPLDGDIWDYLRLVSTKLEDDSMPNLFRENNNSPLVNMMTHLLENHRLRTTYDFEKAVGRALNLTNGKLEWNCNMLDRIGGRGTAASIIFELKKNGKFHGLKRRTNPLNPFPKMRKFENEVNAKKCMTSPKFNIIKDCTKGMVISAARRPM